MLVDSKKAVLLPIMKVNYKIVFKYIVLLTILFSYGFNPKLKHNSILYSIETTSESNTYGDYDYLNDDQIHNPDYVHVIVYNVEIVPLFTKNELNTAIVSPIWQPPKM